MASEDKQDPTAPQLRTDFLGRSVVLTPSRLWRPLDFMARQPVKHIAPADCVFCPGNEHKTPVEIERVRTADGKSGPGGSGWLARIFPNAFPAFDKRSKSAYGVHEVIVETPDHSLTLSQLDEAGFMRYLSLIAKRLRVHAHDKKLKAVAVFKNEWADAGASLEHTHSQLLAMGTIPASIKKEQKVCKSHCPFCLLSIDDRFEKIIDMGPFLAVAPYAPRFNHEVWIVPRAHTASLTDLDETAMAALAKTLRAVLRAQDASLGYPAYNLLFHLAPLREKEYHFRIEITPRLAHWAGFELGSEVVMNSVNPKETASIYKDWLRANP